jgi:hypothetical protein
MKGNPIMSTQYKYQYEFAEALANDWLNNEQSNVRTKIRNLNNKTQAAYIAAQVVMVLVDAGKTDEAVAFVAFIHPNN